MGPPGNAKMDDWDLEVAIPVDGEADADQNDDGNDIADNNSTCLFCGVVQGDVNPVATSEQKASKSEFAKIQILNGADILCRCVPLQHFSHMTQEVCCAFDI